MQTNITIPLRTLGRTDIRVTPIGLGLMELSGGGGWLGYVYPFIPSETKNAIIKAALDGGINWFDTAEVYGGGVSEQALAAGLKAAGKTDHEIVIATKWFPLGRFAGNIKHNIDHRLKNLDGFNINNFMVHQPWSFSSIEAQMNAMADLVEAGRIRSVGVSNFNAWRMERAARALEKRGLPLAVNQMQYSLLHRNIEWNGVLQAAKDLGVTIISYTPLASGLLSGKYHRNPELLKHSDWRKSWFKNELDQTRPLITTMSVLAERHQVTVAQVALNWVIHFWGDTLVAIPGATKPHQAAEAAGAMKFRLSETELAQLDELTRRPN